MPRTDDPLELERAGLRALSGEGDPAVFYKEVLADDVLMLLPGGLVIDDRDTVIASMAEAPPWDEFEVLDERVLRLGESAEVVAYRAKARRGGQGYEALFNSTYIRHHGAWHLAVHQQTPV
ncbi:MAG TPA: nuclear transport factor 2 family protein [Acidimicrobiales bacterium]|nr:nuclear transport factor 2 family protein [Acidimicrobiales bacterium]